MEDAWIQANSSPAGQLTTKMGRLAASNTPDPSTHIFPFRPNFGHEGIKTELWANYFKLNLTVRSLFAYSLTISRPVPVEEEGKPPKKGGKSTSGKKDGDAADTPKGKKLAIIIQLALDQLPEQAVIASEFKQQVITLKKLDLPETNAINVQITDRARPDKWVVTFNGPESLQIDDLMEYLITMKDVDSSFPKFAREIDAIGVILGHMARTDPGTTAIGSGRFFAFDNARADAARDIDQSMVTILRGYFQSVRPATGRLLVNTNVTHGIFRRAGNLGAILTKKGLNRMQTISAQNIDFRYAAQLKEVNSKFLSRVRVRVHFPGKRAGEFSGSQDATSSGLATSRDNLDKNGKEIEEGASPQFTVPRFSYGGPQHVKFLLRAREPQPGEKPKRAPKGLQWGTYVTVAQYYMAKYDHEADLSLPVINTSPPGRRPNYSLAELVEILPGQTIKAKLSPIEQDAMIQFACRPPPSNAHSIVTSARQLLAYDSNNLLLNNFGIAVGKELIKVLARQLPPPEVAYMSSRGNSAQSVLPNDGGWLMKQVKVIRPGRLINNWTYLYFGQGQNPKPTVKNFVQFMKNNVGIQINPTPNPSQIPADGVCVAGNVTLEAAFASLAKCRPQLIFVVLPSKDAVTYNTIKKLGDIAYGFQTVCVQADKFMSEKGQLGYFANVGLKVNLKFGGVNHKLSRDIELIKAGKTMVVGYDVTHPTNMAPGAAANAPSLVGLVASIDRDLAQWPAYVWSMKGKVEMLDDTLVHGFKSRLQLWGRNNKGQLPENIVIFRDGVSEGQFSQVLDQELPKIREACLSLYTSSRRPRISLIVSVKRHQTRFYPTDPTKIHSRSKSPREGTVVDRGVTSVRYWDFFLQAHASLQGTARPAHYTVLLDEIFRADYGAAAANALEKMTHEMCYLYGRATKAVSICPPAYYADLVCTRARIHNDELFDDNQSVASGKSAAATKIIHESLKDTMYYI
ncbi:ribonuclease H-like domain-containing protein [Lasiosphaeria hispida]|uniref:Ribonuclease H-like domain-containing protein n=1 Tax=Lasiosphaeria hispida TaxID=260671 RepID=A0AAJ0HG47_9PEZI|nr:ribonuclease H-like domain-containing protein [Lasiosphaeria hispida]